MEVEEGINGNGKIQFPKADTTEEVIFKKLNGSSPVPLLAF